MSNITTSVTEVDRDVKRRPFSGGEGHGVVLRRAYDPSVEDLWDACTTPARMEQWFLPVSGDLRPGGTYQFEGNAGGEILECEQPHLVRATWVYGEGPPNEVVLRLSQASDDRATLELEHVGPVEGAAVPEFVLGVGPGWDMALAALGMHLHDGKVTDKSWWEESPEAHELIERSVRAWAAVLDEREIASPSVIAKAAYASIAFYTGSEPSPES